MNTLNTIQTLSKIGRILSKIAFICALVGAGICLVSLICLPLLGENILVINGMGLGALTGTDGADAIKLAYAYLVAWLVICAGRAVLGGFARRYFANELQAGTPFTEAGADELKRLGILTICIPVGCSIVADILGEIVAGIMNITESNAVDIAYGSDGTVALGVMFIMGALLCRHGAELSVAVPGTSEE